MGIWQRFIVTIIISGLLTVVVAAQDDITSTPQGNIIVVDSAFVRSGPSNDYIAVGALYAGDSVTPLNISDDSLWILIPYSRGNGWIQRSLVRWEDEAELNLLPILSSNITPTPRIAVTNTPFIPTSTPEGNYVNLEGAASAYVRAGPGRGYLRLGQLLPGENVEGISRNQDTSWIMIRYSNDALPDEFAWVAVELVYWEDYLALEDLPVVSVVNLTPTATFTPSQTPSITASASPTETTTNTATPEPTLTNTLTATSTLTLVPSPTDTLTATITATPVPTLTNTLTPTNTATPEPTLTNTPTATLTLTYTNTPTLTATETNIPTNTITSEPTNTIIPTNTATPEPTQTAIPTNTETTIPTTTNTLTATLQSTQTALPTNTETDIPTATASPTQTLPPSATNTEVIDVVIVASETIVPSNTPTATNTSTETAQVTDIFAVQGTSVAIEATTRANEPEILEEIIQDSQAQSFPVEATVGIILLLFVLSYIWFYWQGLSAIGRYDNGFVISNCPVCSRGTLTIDSRQTRTLGIPTVKRTIRCDECRSILRETGTERWRYAVDGIENPTIFDRFNGREVSDSDLIRLEKLPPQGVNPRTSPEFLDDDSANQS